MIRSDRMNRTLILILWVIIGIQLSAQNQKNSIADAEKQTTFMLGEIGKVKSVTDEAVQNGQSVTLISPRTINATGDLVLVPSKDWTSGFFPGVLWFLYELTGKKQWEKQARKFTANMEPEKFNAGTHDMGFKMYCSYGLGYRLTNDPAYREILIQSAKTLCTRFNPKVGCIRSWDHNTDKWQFPVIIDNMMNLELLFVASRLTGDPSYSKIAVSHANTTLNNHFRPDYSSYHVIDYDTLTGNVLKRNTHQGYSHESAWARGQAWGLYGYTMCYRETKDKKYLDQAEKIASFLLNHPNMPDDLVPYWDYNAPSIPNEPRDVSAAAIAASALYELSSYSKNGSYYRGMADKIIKSLTDKYRSAIGDNKGFILAHSTGSKPSNGEVDVPINYADYYYLEALVRSKK